MALFSMHSTLIKFESLKYDRFRGISTYKIGSSKFLVNDLKDGSDNKRFVIIKNRAPFNVFCEDFYD